MQSDASKRESASPSKERPTRTPPYMRVPYKPGDGPHPAILFSFHFGLLLSAILSVIVGSAVGVATSPVTGLGIAVGGLGIVYSTATRWEKWPGHWGVATALSLLGMILIAVQALTGELVADAGCGPTP